MDWKLILQVGSFGIVLSTILWGQAKAKGNNEIRMKWMESIDTQLNNHITDIKKKLDVIMTNRIKCREEMGDRVSKIEGKMNGKVRQEIKRSFKEC